jgi:hypothetical protein
MRKGVRGLAPSLTRSDIRNPLFERFGFPMLWRVGCFHLQEAFWRNVNVNGAARVPNYAENALLFQPSHRNQPLST